MATLLYIKASPLGSRSFSTAVADAFVDSYRAIHPSDGLIIRDIFKSDMPEFSGLTVSAMHKRLTGTQLTRDELEEWELIEEAVSDFKSADKYVLAVPMWNFGIPYRLKHYFDVILQPGLTYTYAPSEGYRGLILGRPIFIAYARGGEYLPGTAWEEFDFQRRPLEAMLELMGFSEISSVVVEPTVQGGEEVATMRKEGAIERARRMAEKF